MADDDKKDQKDTNESEEPKESKAASDAAQAASEEAKESAEEAQKSAKQAPKPHPPAGGKVSKKLEGIIKDIEELSVLELSQLVKALETRFGVTASAPVAAVSAGATAGATGAEEGTTEQTTFNVIIAEAGANKISVIKVVRELVPTMGLKEAKDLVDATPKELLTGVNKDAANEAKTKLEAAGAKVELK